MKIQLLITLILFVSIQLFGQQDENYYPFTSVEEGKEMPLEVFYLDLSEQDLKDIPTGIEQFENLKILNLSNNDIRVTKGDLSTFKHLETVDFSNNKFKMFEIDEVEVERLSRSD